MKKLLVITDFSDAAGHAVDYACNLANRLNAEQFFILNTYESVPIYDSGEAGSLALSMQEADALEEGRKEELHLLKDRIRSLLATTTKLTTLVVNDALAPAVNQVCDDEDIDLVIMGFKPKDELETFLVGDNVQRGVDKIRYPVLLVPRHAPIAIPDNIVLASDFKESLSKSIRVKLHKFLERFNARVTAVHRCMKNELNERESRLANELQLELQDYHFRLHLASNVEDLPTAVRALAKEDNASLVISIHKMRSFLAGLFHKSITKNLAWRSEVPVLVLHME
ncbi:universal stress protein [Niabella drilacis]|uniref:Nucleotide-binding universal stress protein, UspA family n=1 Tax=Niabella drilacis (strain DSM 25811 / CCM 8410 / CCUG 62505 / LMG 26954 / E90) TaxID=1285928 RepID=A0A1G6TSB4_NIADE|nr:universal stress protein [Niabella drilacis]SDD32003.1 Nucleotide-binding universal stress protein, UspA family [Niabella drilacis]